MAEHAETEPYVLGIDLGAHSLGWAVLPLDLEDRPYRVGAAGVRTFEAGVDASYDEMMQGRQKSRASARREKRGPRRQFWRRAWRRYKVMKCLIAHGLLCDPAGLDIRMPADQDSFVKAIDADLRRRLRPTKDDPRTHLWEQVWLYELRASALERELDPVELGRAFYHLAQRRGFLSNRKTDVPEDDADQPRRSKGGKNRRDEDPDAQSTSEDAGDGRDSAGKEDTRKVKANIEKLHQDMQAAGARTYGQFFARHINPEERRIRQQWTSRQMYEAEFGAICDEQSKYYPSLAENQAFRRELYTAIFYQRPLKPTGHLVGHCSLEPDRRRALWAIPLSQRFRLLQKVNDLTVRDPDADTYRSLTGEERRKLLDALLIQGDMTFKQIRKLLPGFIEPKVNKETKEVERVGHVFSHEGGGEDKLPGDRTAAKIISRDAKAPGIAQRWLDMPDAQREELVLAILDFNDDNALAEHLRKRFSLTPQQATTLCLVRFEEGRCALSRRAMARLLPLLEKGMPFAMAKEQIPEYRVRAIRQTAALDALPRVLATDQRHFPIGQPAHPCFRRPRDLANPAVARALAELRKVVNAIIGQHGKPAYVHVELGREAKKTPLRREIAWENTRLRQNERDEAEMAIRRCKEISISEPKRDDITKWLLAEECKWICPYTGKTITPESLYSSPQFEIEHIVPLSLSQDNSFDNLTLCDAEYNRNVKQKRIPYVVESGDVERWHAILERVKRFTRRNRACRNPNRKAKRRVILQAFPNPKADRFAWTPEQVKEFYGDQFTPRQLTDTQYASRLAGEYLGMLYGGEVDTAGNRRVQVSSGAVTAILREEWGLNGVIPGLPDSPAHKTSQEIRLDEKLRTDHRHHAIDAIVIALTSPRTVQILADAARRVELAELRRQDVRDSQGRRRTRYAEIQPPWGTQHSFLEHVRGVIASIKVSRRPERRIQGPLHAETNYSREIDIQGSKNRRQRVPLDRLSAKDIESDVIADRAVRDAVRTRWRELGGGDPRRVFARPESHPHLPARAGRQSPPIHSVRINVSIKPVTVGQGCRQRHVVSGKDTLHHTVIVAEKTPRGERWRDEPADRLEVHRRRRRGQPVIQTDWGTDHFVMSLCKDDCIEMDDGDGGRAVYVVRALSKGDIKVRLHYDARTDEQIAKAGQRSKFRITSADTLRKRNAQKVTVTPLGAVLREG